MILLRNRITRFTRGSVCVVVTFGKFALYIVILIEATPATIHIYSAIKHPNVVSSVNLDRACFFRKNTPEAHLRRVMTFHAPLSASETIHSYNFAGNYRVISEKGIFVI